MRYAACLSVLGAVALKSTRAITVPLGFRSSLVYSAIPETEYTVETSGLYAFPSTD